MFTSQEKKVIIFLCALFIFGGILRIVKVKYFHTHNYAEMPAERKVLKVNINKDGIKELENIPSIGPVTAQEIINYRKAKGNFRSLQELENIKGIGEGKINIIKKFITF